MTFYLKRSFLNKLNINYEKNIYLKSQNNYISSKSLNIISNKLYNIKTTQLYLYDKFINDHICKIILPDLNISINTSNNMSKNTHLIELDSLVNYKENDYIIKIKEDIEYGLYHNLKKWTNKIYTLFKLISNELSQYLNTNKLYNFKNNLLNNIFNNISYESNLNNSEFLISSVGITGFKSFSSQIPSYENKLFILNDYFSIFKDILIGEILNKSNDLNLYYEIYKNSIDTSIDHIKIPGLNLCIISNNILFNDRIPGTQIYDKEFLIDFENKELFNMKKELNNYLKEFNLICTELKNKHLILNKYFEDYIIKDKFINLIDNTIKNVIL